jgi:hypothetical protein
VRVAGDRGERADARLRAGQAAPQAERPGGVRGGRDQRVEAVAGEQGVDPLGPGEAARPGPRLRVGRVAGAAHLGRVLQILLPEQGQLLGRVRAVEGDHLGDRARLAPRRGRGEVRLQLRPELGHDGGAGGRVQRVGDGELRDLDDLGATGAQGVERPRELGDHGGRVVPHAESHHAEPPSPSAPASGASSRRT